MSGSNSGAVVIPGKPRESLIYTLAAHEDSPKMPPNAPRIPQRELNTIAAWIDSLNDEKQTNQPTTMVAPGASDSTKAKPEHPDDGISSARALPGPMAITALACSNTFMAVSGYQQVLLYDLAQERWHGAIEFPEGDVLSLQFTRDGSKLVAAGGVGGLSGSVVCWDMKSYKRIAEISIDEDVVMAMDVSPDGNRVAVGGPKRTIEIIELQSGKRIHTLRKHADWITQLAYSEDGVLLASADRFGSIYLWDVGEGTQFDTLASHQGPVTGLQWSLDSNQLWSAGKDGYVQRWDLHLGKATQRWQVSSKGLVSMAVKKDQVVSIDNENRLKAYSIDGKEELLAQLSNQPTCMAIGGNTSLEIFVGDFCSGLHQVNSVSREEIKTIPLMQDPKPFVASRFPPRKVDRELQKVTIAEAIIPPSTNSSEKAMLERTREAILASRTTLEQTKKNLIELEERISELQQLIEQLEKSTK